MYLPSTRDSEEFSKENLLIALQDRMQCGTVDAYFKEETCDLEKNFSYFFVLSWEPKIRALGVHTECGMCGCDP